jgi:hypothetical protein
MSQKELSRSGPHQRLDRLPDWSRSRAWLRLAGAITLGASAPLHANGLLTLAMSRNVVSDPLNSTNDAKDIPGAVVDLSLALSGAPTGPLPLGAIAISQVIPAGLALYVGDLGQAQSGPIDFLDHGSGLTWRFGDLSSSDDGIEFSKNGGATFDYVPVPDAHGYDANVNAIRVAPSGLLAASSGSGPRFTIRYRMRIN